jgi:prophage antirepressor-like protein
MSAAIKVFEFEGAALRVYVFRGRACCIAQDVGAALGYTREGFVAALRDWADELIDGQDVQTLRGADLREFKVVAAEVLSTSAKITQLSVLFESGVNLVCLKTEKPLGKTLRRFMAAKVMPALRRGSFDGEEADRARAELVALTLRLQPADASSIWEKETVQLLCKVHRKEIWNGEGRMPFWLKGPMGLIYRIVLGDEVYRELKTRNPDPRDGSLNYNFLTEARHKLMHTDMARVLDALRESRSSREFFERLRFKFKRAALQLSW